VNAYARVRERDKVCLWGFASGDPCAGGLEVHHITFRSHLGDDTPENLIVLCTKHHQEAQSHAIKAEDLRGLLSTFYGYTYNGEYPYSRGSKLSQMRRTAHQRHHAHSPRVDAGA
jgi:hypothetical protein